MHTQDYCQATLADGSVGLVPKSAILERPGVMLQPMPWFHGPITRYVQCACSACIYKCCECIYVHVHVYSVVGFNSFFNLFFASMLCTCTCSCVL